MNEKQFERDINKYLTEIKSLVICDRKTQKKFLCDIKNDLYEYIENNSVSDINNVYEQFGTPKDIADGFFLNSDTKHIKKKINIRNSVLISIIIILLVWVIGVTITIIDAHYDYDGHFNNEQFEYAAYDEVIAEVADDEVTK